MNSITKNIKSLLQGLVVSFVVTTSVFALVIIPSGATVTDPLAQGYTSCTPGNCVIATSTGGTTNGVTATTTGVIAAYASTSIGAAVLNATATGIFFLSASGTLTQDTANFNYDAVTKKLTVTGGIDPLYFQAKDISGLGAAYYEAYDGNNAATSTANTGRLRYSTSTQTWQMSMNGSAYQDILVSGGSIAWLNATGGNATVTNIFGTNASITNATTTNLFSALFNSIFASITSLLFNNATGANATITGTFAVNGTTQMATTSILNVRDSFGNYGTAGQVLSTTGTSTRWTNPSTAAATSTYQAIQFNDGLGNFLATSTFTYSTTSGLQFGTSQRIAVDTAGRVTAGHFDVTAAPVPGTSYYMDLDLNGTPDVINGSITLVKGQIYRFYVNTPADPFYITTNRATPVASAYNTGVNNNGAVSGIVTFLVPQNAPSKLYYQSSANSPMGGSIFIVDPSTISNENNNAYVYATTTPVGDIVKLFASSTEVVTVTGAGAILNGTTTIATSTVASTSIVWANITNLFAQVLNVLGFTATNATITNATSTNIATANLNATSSATLASTTLSGATLSLGDLRVLGTTTLGSTTITSIQDSYGTFGTAGQYLITTGTSTKWASLTAANVATGTYQSIQFNDGANNLTATSAFAYSTTTGLRFANNRVAIMPNGTVIAANFDITNSPTLSYNFDFDFNGIADVANPSIT